LRAAGPLTTMRLVLERRTAIAHITAKIPANDALLASYPGADPLHEPDRTVPRP
jgi:hypothetical protein